MDHEPSSSEYDVASAVLNGITDDLTIVKSWRASSVTTHRCRATILVAIKLHKEHSSPRQSHRHTHHVNSFCPVVEGYDKQTCRPLVDEITLLLVGLACLDSCKDKSDAILQMSELLSYVHQFLRCPNRVRYSRD
jgi:hypothetical protein